MKEVEGRYLNGLSIGLNYVNQLAKSCVQSCLNEILQQNAFCTE